MNHIKIEQAGWAGFTGNFGGVEFVDGVSVVPVTQTESDRLSSSVFVVNADTNEQVGVTTRYNDEKATFMPVEDSLPQITDEEIAASIVDAGSKMPAAYFTGEELEIIADEKGIAGLRAVAEPLGVKARAIPDLIANILAAQDAVRSRIAAAEPVVSDVAEVSDVPPALDPVVVVPETEAPAEGA